MQLRFALLLFAATLLGAETDFSGVWRLSVAKSDFGRVNPPQSQQVSIRQTGSVLAVETVLSDQRGSSRSNYTLDATGKPIENTIRGVRVESTASWRGPVLHVKSKTTIQNQEIRSVDQWQLSAGGAELVIYRTAGTPQGEVEQRFVYQKAAAKP